MYNKIDPWWHQFRNTVFAYKDFALALFETPIILDFRFSSAGR